MHISKALNTVREALGTRFERETGSPTAARKPERVQEVDACIARLQEEFLAASQITGTSVLWPKMIIGYKQGDQGRIPVWGPILDSDRYTLSLRVVRKDLPTKPASARAYIEWHPPENV